MTLTKADLARQLQLKITGQMRGTAVPDRFGQSASAALEKKEKRKLDAAAGLVPFACKLPSELIKKMNERGAAHEGGLNGWLAQVLEGAVK
jgi:hypothetical protein